MKENANKYVQVIVNIPSLHMRTFSYLIPDEIKEKIQIGLPVLVPFGSQGVVNAYIVGFSDYLPEGIKAKSVYEILDNVPVFDLEYLQFLEWVSNYYCCDLPTVISTAIPVNFFSKAKRVAILQDIQFEQSKLNKSQQTLYEILVNNPKITVSSLQKKAKLPSSKFYETLRKLVALDIIKIDNVIDIKNQKPKIENWIELLEKNSSNKRHFEILAILDSLNGKSKLSDFLKISKTTYPTVKKLQEAGNIKIIEQEIYRNPLEIFEIDETEDFLELSFEQNEALERISKAIEKEDSDPLLLYGVTGSGKTEVYFHAAKKTLDAGKNVIFLAPEIPLASQLAYRISKRFGTDKVGIWHSNLSEGERFDIWQRIRNNEISIIIGARSAIFAPIKNIGLIIIDEEHESSYKQTSPTPRYNAKDLAKERAKRSGAAFVLGSATPDIATYYQTLNSNRVMLLPERFGAKDLAKVAIIDMKQEYGRGNKGVFSRALRQAIERNIKEKKQSILLINRRGFSTYTFCDSCGYTAECKKCSIPLILHKTNNKLRCHYCSFEQNIFTVCPKCSSNAVRYYGMGTQKVEEEFKKEFPEAKVARLDSDTMAKKNAHIDVIKEFSNGKIDVLIGTQMIAKGLDIPNVTLVGVLMSDSLFNMPDFRSSERGFQLLTQVAGRAGRGDFKGTVYFQTYTPDFFALQTAKEQDYLSFYYSEIQSRYEYSYPPYSQIIRLILSSKNEIRASKFSDKLAYKLSLFTDSRGIQEKLEVLGPAPCVISKIKNEYRFQIIIKNRLGENGHFLATSFIRQFNVPEDIKFLIDVDPSDML
ncbi:MAG: primosomal protein N' [Candidatus Melainabacteria bacterium GWF2_32_7]|nr:MAG: primosomal protein N' [Candidatus Melainabacteria bacterium GWF2_32_7]